MKLAFEICVGFFGAFWSLKELVIGLRSGSMSTLGAFAAKAGRAEKPGLFWFNATANAIVGFGLLFALIMLWVDGR
jgi:hypothetical protein